MKLRPRQAAFTITVAAFCLLTVAAWGWLTADLPQPDDLPQHIPAPGSQIFDRHGRLLYEVIDPARGRHVPVTLDDMPSYLLQATVATEDANFYRHPGVDLWAILRAARINLQGGEVLAGGSTITQQVARNLLFSPEERVQRTLTRKLREGILAWRLARAYSRDEILALYLNLRRGSSRPGLLWQTRQ
jgi:membrane peptidoglycan carboxypeptidase